ncbi:hypothetical protein NIES4102_34190 [Chondrocystis sp. NIES-4102]|nr:hypothetical protein NIES4102_34190 [Chondrocystis sp. NIES-4102]
MINKLLSTAFKLYLRSQLTHTEDLQISILGKNSQILQGNIPGLLLSCTNTVYQGLFLESVAIKGADIKFNLSEVLKQKPWQLLEPIIVEVKLSLNSDDLQASLASPLLQSALNDLWQIILNIETINNKLINSTITWENIAIAPQGFDFTGIYRDAQGKIQPIKLFTQFALDNPHTLNLNTVEITDISVGLQRLEHPLPINLGSDVLIEQLIFDPQQILCAGKIIIKPIS